MKAKSSLFLASSMLLLAAPAQAAVIEFTSPDYSDGALNTQSNWAAQSSWTVANSAGTGNASSTTVNQVATYGVPVALGVGASYSYSINFELTGTIVPLADLTTYVFQTGLKADNTATAPELVGSTAADVNMQIFGPTGAKDNYRLLNNFNVITGFSQADSGLDAGDILQLDYTLTMGADAATTVFTARLQNLNDSYDSGTGTITGIDASIYSALSGSGAYLFMQTDGFAANASGVTGVQVNSITIVPEPSTFALLGLGGLALLRRRR